MNTVLKTILIASCIFLATNAQVALAQANATPGDREAVKLVMQNFIRAFETDDANLLRSVFRNDSIMVGYSKSRRQLVTSNGEEWAKNFDGKLAEDEAQRKRSFEILDVTAIGAVGKLIIDYPSWYGIDYIALSKIDDKWMIVSKSWSGFSKPTPKP